MVECDSDSDIDDCEEECPENVYLHDSEDEGFTRGKIGGEKSDKDVDDTEEGEDDGKNDGNEDEQDPSYQPPPEDHDSDEDYVYDGADECALC